MNEICAYILYSHKIVITDKLIPTEWHKEIFANKWVHEIYIAWMRDAVPFRMALLLFHRMEEWEYSEILVHVFPKILILSLE